MKLSNRILLKKAPLALLEALRGCSNLLGSVCPSEITLSVIRSLTLKKNSLADRLLTHYCESNGVDFCVSSSILFSDPAVAAFLEQRIWHSQKNGEEKGIIVVPQELYEDDELCYALGGLSVSWKKSTTNQFLISFEKEYRFSPKEKRVSQALHQAACALAKEKDSCAAFKINGLRTKRKILVADTILAKALKSYVWGETITVRLI